VTTRVFFLFASYLSLAYSFDIVEVTGTVRNQAGVPAANLAVILEASGVADSTDESGAFELVRQPTFARLSHTDAILKPHIEGTRLVFQAAGAGHLSVELFSLSGRKAAVLADKTVTQGQQSVLLDARRLSSSAMVLVFRLGTEVMRWTLVNAGGRMLAKPLSAAAGEQETLQKRHGAEETDTLVIMRGDIVELKARISMPVDTLDILLDLVPYEVITCAYAEMGRGPDQVGQDLEHEPYDLGQYLEPGEAWCSEFASWAYKAAGYPFTNGYQIDWMLRGSTTIRSWFRIFSRFVTRDSTDWDTFVPAPGDYVRYDNDQGGHSGIVWLARNDSLYTIEGNVSDKVVARALRNWKQRVDIDGIGMRSGSTGSRVHSVKSSGYLDIVE